MVDLLLERTVRRHTQFGKHREGHHGHRYRQEASFPIAASASSPPRTQKEYFFHRSGLEGSLDFDRLVGGERVEFEVEQSPKGPRANKVRAA